MNAYDLTYFTKSIAKRNNVSTFPIGQARVPGTCGELMQGTLGGVDFLINSPIPYFAELKVTLHHERDVSVATPGQFSKVQKAVRAVLDMSGHKTYGARIEIVSSIPRGKGLASSTAEITAAIAATSLALGKPRWKDAYSDIVLSIDHSTDAVYVPGIVNCSFLTGGIIEQYSSPPDLSFIIVDAGGEVETMSFDREKARVVSRTHERRLYKAYQMMRFGLKNRIAGTVAQACTESALINQEILPKPLLSTLLHGTAEYGALGVNCAHTGTILGVMFNPQAVTADDLLNRVETLVGREGILGVYPLISGGSK